MLASAWKFLTWFCPSYDADQRLVSSTQLTLLKGGPIYDSKKWLGMKGFNPPPPPLGRWGYPTKSYVGRLHPEAQILTISYIIPFLIEKETLSWNLFMKKRIYLYVSGLKTKRYPFWVELAHIAHNREYDSDLAIFTALKPQSSSTKYLKLRLGFRSNYTFFCYCECFVTFKSIFQSCHSTYDL